jgi:hypothetical protein
MSTLLWTKTGPGHNTCVLDGVTYTLAIVPKLGPCLWQVTILDPDREDFASDFFTSEVEAAVWADGFAAAEGTNMDRYNAGYEALRRWGWLGQLWSAPETQPIETLD